MEVYSNGTEYIIFIVSAIAVKFRNNSKANFTIEYFLICSFLQLGLALSYIYLPLFFNLQMTSSFHYLERRFGRPVRLMASAIYVLKSLCFVPLVVYVPALALSQGK